MTKKPREVVAYTDGSCRKGCGGFGIHFPGETHRDTFGRLPFKRQDSLRAEIYAVIRVVQLGGHKRDAQLIVYTDKSVSMLQDRLQKWLKPADRGMRRHADLLQILDRELKSCAIRPIIRLMRQTTEAKEAHRRADSLAYKGTQQDAVPSKKCLRLGQ